MSVTILSRVFWTQFDDIEFSQGGKKITVGKPSAKLVMLSIADNSDDFGENSWQSFETIATKSGIERRSVIRVIKALIESGYLSINGKSLYGTNDYKVNLSKLGNIPTSRAKTGRPKTGDSGVTTFVETGDSDAKSSDSGAESGDSGSPESSFNHPLTVNCAEAQKRGQINPNTGRRTDAKVQGDPMDGMLYAARQSLDPETKLKSILADYPADCQQTLRWFIEIWRWPLASIPAKPSRGKGGEYSRWILELREINTIIEGFGKSALQACVAPCQNLSVSHPLSIKWALPGEIGKLSRKKDEKSWNGLDTPFAKALETYTPKQRPPRPGTQQQA